MTRYLVVTLLASALLAASAAAQTSLESRPRTSQEKIADLAASWRFTPLTIGETAATASMVLAFGLLAFAIGTVVADASKPRLRKHASGPWIDVGVILAWSVFVRFVLTEPNILTDGGSGYRRVMQYTEGYGGIAVLVKLFPAEWSAFMWRAMLVPRVLAALSPALVASVAHGLGLGRPVALIAGLALASLPVHAVLTASDLLVGSLSSLQLAGVVMVLLSRRNERSDLFAAGVAFAAWGVWVRPEGALGLLPVAAACLSFSRTWWGRRDVQVVVAAALALVVLRAVVMATDPRLASDSSPGPLGTVAWGTVVFSTVLVPVWLWMPVPFAVRDLYRRGAVAIAAAGLAAGLIPVYLRGLNPDPANTHLETLRYGTPALAWLALVSAVGIDAVCRWIGRRRPNGRSRLLFATRVLAVLLVVSPVAVHHEYLGRRYGHATSEEAIRSLLRRVPQDCGLLVPDDFPEGVTIEIYPRYAFIAAEAYATGDSEVIEVRPASDLLDGKVGFDRCWTYLRGPYCYHAFGAPPAKTCAQLEARFRLEEIASIPIEFRHHRLVTGPDVRRAPWYMERMPVALYRVTGPDPAE